MSRDDADSPKPEEPEAVPLENTAGLLARHQSGDPLAKERLFGRYLPILQRWAHHRLPGGARDLRDTDDLVQDTLMRAFRNIDTFQHRGEGAFLAYLRQILVNAIRDDIRKVAGRPRPATLEDVHADAAPSALEDAIGRESVERFERALARLDPEPREAVILRIEFGFSHQQVADALGKPTAEAARATVARALVALSKVMNDA
jgi:RNA polymerase sigma-70 factor (ECF subfamily)